MQEHPQAKPETSPGAKRQLMLRGALAVALVLALLAVLVLLERKPERTDEPPVTARTVTPPTPRVEPPTSSSPPLADSAKELVTQSADAPDATNASLASAPVAATSAPQGVPEETLDPTVPILGVPGKSAKETPRAPAKAPENVPVTPRLTLSEPAVRPTIVKPGAKPEPQEAKTSGREAFIVQLGVFSDYANAEQLHKKLNAVGIASQLETRVQVGPFKTRQEALAAQAQLKRLGLEGGMVVNHAR